MEQLVNNSVANSIETTLAHLTQLVAFDTQNPPRKITINSEIFEYLKNNLKGFCFEFFDAGDGCIALLAKRGTPDLLFNFHIDTVPAGKNWHAAPFQLKIDETKAIGLGACDIKGASACMLTAAAKTTNSLALLFSSDEEFGNSAAIKHFLNSEHGFNQVIVAEPTMASAVIAHRGIQSAKALFKGIAGHASEARAISDNAIHKACLWSSKVISWLTSQQFVFESLQGLPFNIGKIEGGIKANMIAADCELAFGFRPLPGQDSKKLLQQLTQLQGPNKDIEIKPGFSGPTLPAANQDFNAAIKKSTKMAQSLNLPLADPVNFWTEASLFSQAGLTALVFGPGDIAQAHAVDEWVALEQLATVEQTYINIINLQQNAKG